MCHLCICPQDTPVQHASKRALSYASAMWAALREQVSHYKATAKTAEDSAQKLAKDLEQLSARLQKAKEELLKSAQDELPLAFLAARDRAADLRRRVQIEQDVARKSAGRAQEALIKSEQYASAATGISSILELPDVASVYHRALECALVDRERRAREYRRIVDECYTTAKLQSAAEFAALRRLGIEAMRAELASKETP